LECLYRPNSDRIKIEGLMIRVKENLEFLVYPNWNVKFSVREKEITIDLNYKEEA